jgi:hypothetical protein
MRNKLLFVLITLFGLAGCATDWPHNLYEGVRQQQGAVPDPKAAQPTAPLPDYDQYRRERDTLKGDATR